MSVISRQMSWSKVLTWVCLIPWIMALLYTAYRSEVVFHGSLHEAYLPHYVISLSGILFWSVVLKLKETWRVHVLMVSISLGVGVVLMSELYDAYRFWNFRQGHGPDPREKLEVIQDLERKGVMAVPTVFPRYSLKKLRSSVTSESPPLLALGGIAHRTTIYCREGGPYTIYLADRYGFRNPDEVWDHSPIQWFLIGDSFTQGACVQSGEDIGSQLRLITEESVINTGIGANGPFLELGVLKEYAEFLRPKRVLWLYFDGNDLNDLRSEQAGPLLRNYLQSDFTQGLRDRQPEIDEQWFRFVREKRQYMEIRQPLSRVSRLLKKVGLHRLRFSGDGLPRSRQRLPLPSSLDPLFGTILTQARDRTASWGG